MILTIHRHRTGVGQKVDHRFQIIQQDVKIQVFLIPVMHTTNVMVHVVVIKTRAMMFFLVRFMEKLVLGCCAYVVKVPVQPHVLNLLTRIMVSFIVKVIRLMNPPKLALVLAVIVS